MSKSMKVRERKPALHILCMVALLLQWVCGGVMTLSFFSTGWLYGLLAGLSLVVAFIWFVGKEARGGRVTARVLVALTYVFAGIPVAEMVLGLIDGWANISFAKCAFDMCCMTLPVLVWLAPAVGYVALSRGRYDRFVACFTQVWAAVSLLLVLALGLDINWLMVGEAFVAILTGSVIFATVMVFLCAFVRPRDKAPATIDDGETTLQLETLE